MAVSFDTKFEKGTASSATPFSFVSNAGTVAGTVAANSNRVLIAYVAFRAVAAAGVAMTWNGVAMTSIGSITSTAGGQFDLFIFGLINPASGAQTLSVSWTGGGTGGVVLGAWSLYNADQSTGWQNFASNSATSTAMTSGAITSANGNMVVCGTCDNDASSASITSGTSDWDERSLSGNYEGGHIAVSGATGTVSWTLGTSVEWATVAVDVIAAGAGGGGGVSKPSTMTMMGVQ